MTKWSVKLGVFFHGMSDWYWIVRSKIVAQDRWMMIVILTVWLKEVGGSTISFFKAKPKGSQHAMMLAITKYVFFSNTSNSPSFHCLFGTGAPLKSPSGNSNFSTDRWEGVLIDLRLITEEIVVRKAIHSMPFREMLVGWLSGQNGKSVVWTKIWGAADTSIKSPSWKVGNWGTWSNFFGRIELALNSPSKRIASILVNYGGVSNWFSPRNEGVIAQLFEMPLKLSPNFRVIDLP